MSEITKSVCLAVLVMLLVIGLGYVSHFVLSTLMPETLSVGFELRNT